MDTCIRMRDLDTQMALLDRDMNAIVDSSLTNLVATRGLGSFDES